MISKHITFEEATKSQESIRKGIDNIPNDMQLDAMKFIAEIIFEPIRTHFNKPIHISSFFRSEGLNEAIGGSKTSQHCKGEAMDIDADIFGGLTNREVFEYVKETFDFDQLIWEFGNEDNPAWVHVSCKRFANRNQILRAIKESGKINYISYATAR